MGKKKEFVLRTTSDKTEDDKYKYFMAHKNGFTFTTPFKDRATKFIEGVEIASGFTVNDMTEIVSVQWLGSTWKLIKA